MADNSRIGGGRRLKSTPQDEPKKKKLPSWVNQKPGTVAKPEWSGNKKNVLGSPQNFNMTKTKAKIEGKPMIKKTMKPLNEPPREKAKVLGNFAGNAAKYVGAKAPKVKSEKDQKTIKNILGY